MKSSRLFRFGTVAQKTGKTGRSKEIAEIVQLRRAAEVGRLMLGELDGPLGKVTEEDYHGKTRAELRVEREAIRASLKKELITFCRNNFVDATPKDLAALYDLLAAHGGEYRLPLQEFVARVGRPSLGVLKDAPAHATVHLSPWGLQTEYPEMHLARDLALGFNDALDAEKSISGHQQVRWEIAKTDSFVSEVAPKLRRGGYSRRMCLLCCFNLAEAYINGISWEFVQSTDVASLSNRQQRLLTEGNASLIDKLVKVPPIVRGREPGPLATDRNPLKTFREIVKPYRDSVVHASPFSAPERYGGYDKLSRVYELELSTVKKAVDLTIEILASVHTYLTGKDTLPGWMPPRDDSGRFDVA